MNTKRRAIVRGTLRIRTANGDLDLLAGHVVGILRDHFIREQMYASCLTCIHIDTDSATERYYCKKYLEFPPLHILVNSCVEGYEDNEDIPF